MANPSIPIISERTVDAAESDLDGWRKVEGDPSMKAWREYTADDNSVVCGHWEATPGTYHATYNAWEFIHLLEDKITITPDGGEVRHVGPGDTFIIEKGFKGTWHIEEKARKVCACKLK